jgi:hypothetical protein
MVTVIPNTTLSTCPPGGCIVVFGVFYKYGSDSSTNTFLQQLNPALQSRGAVRLLSSPRTYCMSGCWFALLHLLLALKRGDNECVKCGLAAVMLC